MRKIIIAGGSGFIGSRLVDLLLNHGYEVCILSRKERTSQRRGLSYKVWKPDDRILEDRIFWDAYAVINLAGANIGKRWTSSYKRRILKSRINSTATLVEKINTLEKLLSVFINASAVGYYGGSSELKYENDEPGTDFMAEVCRQWEAEASKLKNTGRQIILRMGVVLGKEGGALPKMAWPFKLGLGAPLGSGEQIFSWVHIEDICRLFLYCIETASLQGTYNALSPVLATNSEFTNSLVKVMNKPAFLPAIPTPLIKLLLGELAGSLLESYFASSKRLMDTGFKFKYPDLDAALQEIYS